MNSSSNIPQHVKTSCVQYFMRKNRALEEKLIIKSEMRNVINYWESQKSALENKRREMHSVTNVILSERICYIKQFMRYLRLLFNSYIGPFENEEEEPELDVEANNEHAWDVRVDIAGVESRESSDDSSDDSDEGVEAEGFYV